MKPAAHRTSRTADRTHRAAPRGAWLAAMLVALATIPVAALAVGPTVQSVARETLLETLAPALAIRGATAVVTVAPPDARRELAPCNQMAGFMPTGARLSGRTTVGVRCVDGADWQAFVTAEIRVEGPTWQSSRALRAGDTIASGDLVAAVTALTSPDLEAAAAVARSAGTPNRSAASSRGLVSIDGRTPAPIGRIVLRPVATGRALTAADIRDEGRINPGDPVRVVYLGDGFSVSSEGHSVGAADPGGNVLIRLAGGALVNGTVRADHRVELPR